MKNILYGILILMVLIMPAIATIEYSEETGKECLSCHVSENGGTQLSGAGKNYKVKLVREGRYKEKSLLLRLLKLIIGFIHMITAVMWIGTILYIHIILKPKYVAGGIPKNELKIGWISMLIMLFSGIYLTIRLFPTPAALYTTSMGILLLVKIGLFLFMVAAVIIVTFSIAPKINSSAAVNVSPEYRDLTPEELLLYNGKGDNPAFLAYKGTVYDVSKSKLWPKGRHMGRHPTGLDLTDTLPGAPHGEDLVKLMPVVGRLIPEEGGEQKKFHVKLFYFLAYAVLVVIFLIIFIISIWKWW